jgi:predicted aminopeptidase
MKMRYCVYFFYITISISLCGCATDFGYLWKQGGYLFKDNFGARDVDSILREEQTPQDTRAFLEIVQEIKRFAVERIGLKDNGNYTRYKELDADYLVNVVQACDSVSFTPFFWSYQFLGKLPYKGFYERPDAEAEAARLETEGYDVIVRKTDAFSTLGFFKDPLYSFMKRYSPYELSSLVFHEQTHATVFLTGQAQFNEELATFVGDEGAFEFLIEKYGSQSEEHRKAIAEKADHELFLSYVKDVSQALEEIYTSTLPREEKLKQKRDLIAVFKAQYLNEIRPRLNSDDYRSLVNIPLNNAYLSLYNLYTQDNQLLTLYFTRECGSDLKRFIENVKQLAGSPGDVVQKMRQELQPGTG